MRPEAATFLDKAGRSLDASCLLLKAGHADFAASRAYYVMLYAVDALLSDRGDRFYDHASSHGAFEEHFVRTGLIDPKYHVRLVQRFDTRIVADYSIDAPFPHDEAARMFEEAREFLGVARALLEHRHADV